MGHVELARKANHFRKEILRMITAANSGHPGGSLSAIDVMTYLYFKEMRHDPKNPHWDDRDRFILSKGHAAPALYTVLAYSDYFSPDMLPTLRRLGSPLQGHPERHRLAGAEASTGSLGQGLSIGVGMALAARLDQRDYRTYVMMGDGELNEGQVWEAAMFAASQNLGNLVAIVDKNKQQLDDWTGKIMDLDPLGRKWEVFGWHVIDIDGHDFNQIGQALAEARQVKDKPTVLIAHTIKGKGVSFMENNLEFHGMAATPAQLEQALAELDANDSKFAQEVNA